MTHGFESKDDLVRYITEHDVKIINLWFVDILGMLKSFGITPSQLEEALEEGLGFDGSSVEGFARIYESDLIAIPDPRTFQILPWRVDGQIHARMICDILNPDRTPYAGDPRNILRRNLERAEELGFRSFMGPELEYFYLKASDDPTTLDHAGYFDLVPDDFGTELRHRTIQSLQAIGIAVEVGHHEVAPSQHEIDLKYKDALEMADATVTYRYVVKRIARENGVYATFMPKPLYGENGNGMHVHQSLFRGEQNAFFDGDDSHPLSKVGQGYMAGIMRHAREICAVTNQWVNSYKRLVPGYEAPVYVAWGRRNRSALVRVPMYKPGKEAATRIEFRCPDPACNPYLAFSVMIAAGLEGIREGYEVPAPVDEDIYHMSETEKTARGIETLPDSLYAALELAAESELIQTALGEHLFTKFIENKRIEWDEYRTRVTGFEVERYLPIL
ncbi:MAG: glutamine synthetase [Candidatus Eisenbacteria bacterium]|nr:glutamine synthetase [Candidatus Latescibacterota bacterium]MBD3302345.1 glutamine synthetase [Candidatus Eisenbacteria bacterium]